MLRHRMDTGDALLRPNLHTSSLALVSSERKKEDAKSSQLMAHTLVALSLSLVPPPLVGRRRAMEICFRGGRIFRGAHRVGTAGRGGSDPEADVHHHSKWSSLRRHQDRRWRSGGRR
eukprot:7053701-Prymnesium_polylepis.2